MVAVSNYNNSDSASSASVAIIIVVLMLNALCVCVWCTDIYFRAIFRWITIKDLNALQFNEIIKDTPLGLLRGIKFGTETYHTLFKRLCR